VTGGAGGGLAALLALPRDVPRGRPLPVPVPEAVAPVPAPAASVPATPRRRFRYPYSAQRELGRLARQREAYELREAAAVKIARSNGLSWREIADALDVPVTTVHGRYR
jgi:DNA-directed RNA polymerase specialized sigma24 family protein